MKLKIDENLPTDAAESFRQAGHDVQTVREEALVGKPDGDIAKAAQHEGRAIVTLDTDFGNIRSYPPAEYAGIVVLRLEHLDRHHVLAMVEAILPFLEREPLVGRLWIVEEHRIRIRSGAESGA